MSLVDTFTTVNTYYFVIELFGGGELLDRVRSC
jgi:hypothetical protein